jgi:hypothetical protein
LISEAFNNYRIYIKTKHNEEELLSLIYDITLGQPNRGRFTVSCEQFWELFPTGKGIFDIFIEGNDQLLRLADCTLELQPVRIIVPTAVVENDTVTKSFEFRTVKYYEAII